MKSKTLSLLRQELDVGTGKDTDGKRRKLYEMLVDSGGNVDYYTSSSVLMALRDEVEEGEEGWALSSDPLVEAWVLRVLANGMNEKIKPYTRRAWSSFVIEVLCSDSSSARAKVVDMLTSDNWKYDRFDMLESIYDKAVRMDDDKNRENIASTIKEVLYVVVKDLV